MGDGKCPDIYECRLGIDRVLRRSMRLEGVVAAQQKELKLLRELENVVRYCHGRSYNKKPKREEAAVLTALEKLRTK